jgi:hypothetical protein
MNATVPVHVEGTLRFTPIDGFEPPRPTRYTIITAPEITGTFDTLDLRRHPPRGRRLPRRLRGHRGHRRRHLQGRHRRPIGVLDLSDITVFTSALPRPEPARRPRPAVRRARPLRHQHLHPGVPRRLRRLIRSLSPFSTRPTRTRGLLCAPTSRSRDRPGRGRGRSPRRYHGPTRFTPPCRAIPDNPSPTASATASRRTPTTAPSTPRRSRRPGARSSSSSGQTGSPSTASVSPWGAASATP